MASGTMKKTKKWVCAACGKHHLRAHSTTLYDEWMGLTGEWKRDTRVDVPQLCSIACMRHLILLAGICGEYQAVRFHKRTGGAMCSIASHVLQARLSTARQRYPDWEAAYRMSYTHYGQDC